MNKFLKQYFKSINSKYIDLILFKTYADLKAESARGYLGMLWWVIEPVLYMGTFYIVFSVIRNRGEGDFIPFLLVGLVSWKWFASTILQGSKSIEGSVGLMHHVYLPKYIFPSVVSFTNLFKFLLIFFILIVFLLLYGIHPSIVWLTIPVLIITQFTMMLSISFFLSSVVPFIPDLTTIINNVLTLLFFLSGIIFDIQKAPSTFKKFLYFNPMVGIVENYRSVLINQEMPNLISLSITLLSSFLLLFIALAILAYFDRIYPKILIK